MGPSASRRRRFDHHGRGRACVLGTGLIAAMLLAAAPAASAAGAGAAIGLPAPGASKSVSGRDTAADAPRLTPAKRAVTRAAVGATTVKYDAAARKATLRVDDGFELDQYLFSDSSPLTFDIDLRGIKPPSGEAVPLTMRVFDVDQAGAPGNTECAVEVDNVNINGTHVGQLSGADSQWSIVSLSIPAGVLTSGVNHVAIDIDVLTGSCWAVQVDWASVEVPFALAQTEAEATNDVSIKRGKSDDVIPDTVWKRTFKADGTLNAPNPDDPIADKISGGWFGWGAREFTYKYTLDGWRERPTFDPKVEYAWEISGGGPDSGGYHEEQGWVDDFTVKLPDKIGKYTLKVTLKVSLDDELLTTEVRTHTVYVILDSPVGTTTVSGGAAIATGTPRTAWLDVAMSWASGKSTNVDILAALNSGAYGGGSSPLGWGYGYPKVGPVTLIENGAGQNGDCFVFRDVWRILAASLGITTSSTDYAPAGGFLTSTRKALDNNASAQSINAATGTRDRWLFGNHQYGTFGGKFYDPTFGLVGANTNAGKEGNVFCKLGAGGKCPVLTPPPGEVKVSSAPGSVNGWSLSRYAVTIPRPAPRSRTPRSSAGTIVSVTDSGRDIDGNGLFEQLAASLSLNVVTGGEFSVLATLTSAGGDVLATGDLNADTFTNAPTTTVTLAAGARTVPVYFSGRTIREAGFDGPYTLTVELYDDAAALADDATHTTAAYDGDAFQGALVELGTITDHADAAALHVDVAADATATGDVAVAATLFAGSQQVGEVSRTQHLTAGAHTLALDFDGETIAANGIDGPYDVFVSVADDLYVAEAQHTTAAYDAGDFTLPAAAFVGAITDAAIDDDADGDADHLRVTAPLAARVAGTYTLRALLEDSSGTFIAAAEASAPLDVAPTDVTVSFPGEEIGGQDEDGPYHVVLAIVDAAGDDVAGRDHDTAAYAHTDFAQPSARFGTFADHGVDATGDGLFEILSVDATVSVHEAGTYVVEGSLLDAAGTFIASAASVPQFLDPGEHTVSLPFEGGSIRDSATDGPYLVSGLELKLAGDSVDAIAGTRSTAAYLRTAFQGAGARTTGTVADRTEDTDADGLHDTLAADIELSVGASDFYSYNARLVDGAGNEIVWSSGSEFLDSGLRTITLRFDGRWIQGNGADGPFRIENLSVYSATRTFTQAEVHTTSAYAASAFEPAGAVRGRVLLGGAPVAGADVFIAGIDGDVSDAAGRFRLVAVNGGTQTVSLDTTEPGPWRIIVDGEIVGEGTSTSVELPLGEVRTLTFSAGDTDAPALPSLTGSDPDSPANDNAPHIKGSAEAGSTVKLYASSDCTGPVAAQGTAAELASPGLSVTVADDSTTTFHATATDESINTSACSTSSVTYVEDSLAPAAPGVTGSAPGSPSSDNSPRITGSAEAGSTVKLYAGAACSGPVAGQGSADAFASPGLSVAVASDSTTTFHATATDASGNVSPCSSTSVSYVEDSTAPSATIGSGPSGTTEDTTPTFEFSTNDAGAALTCRVDSAAFAPCASPLTTAALAEGHHAFDVRATDAAGNVGSDSRSFVVKITTTPPPPRVPPHPGCSATGNVILGTSGNDTRAGTPAKDLMFGLRGNDALAGRGGSDCLYGNEGADRLSGGTGNDVIRGGSGRDHLTGNAGNDEVVDTSGRDELSGGSGNDRLNARDTSRSGRRVADVVRCGPGRRDVALVDRRDRVSRDCEQVRRR